jgi:NIMA-interacting peptidyl-prolyl cis-trans isomerase 1
MRWVYVLSGLLALVVGCGGSSPPPESAQGKPGKLSKGEQCLRDAAAPREPPPNAPGRVELSHILVRHDALKRPQGATRSPEEACLRALEARAKLEAGANWAEVVKEYSDAGQDMEGAIGFVSYGDLEPNFANAAFALEMNELSYVVETERGFHIILRTE